MLSGILLLVYTVDAILDCGDCNYRASASSPGKWFTALSSTEECGEIDATSVLKAETSISQGSSGWYGIVPSIASAKQSSICGFVDADGLKFSCALDINGRQCGTAPEEGQCLLRMTAPTENAVISTYNWTNIINGVTQLDVFPSTDCESGICNTVYLTSLVRVELQDLVKNALRSASDICYTQFDLLEYSIDSCVNTQGRTMAPGNIIVNYVPSRMDVEDFTAKYESTRRRLAIPGPLTLLASKFLRFTVTTIYERWTATSVKLGAVDTDGNPIRYIELSVITENDLNINKNIKIEIVGDTLFATSTNASACCSSGTIFYVGINTQPAKVNVTNVTFAAIERVQVEQTLINTTTGQNYTINTTVETPVFLKFSEAEAIPLQYVALTDYIYYPPPPPEGAPPSVSTPPSTPPSSTKSNQPSLLLIILIIMFSSILFTYCGIYIVIPRLGYNSQSQNWINVVYDNKRS